MHDRRPQFLAELTQMSADIDKLLPQFAQFAEHYKGLAMASHAPIPPALGVIEGSVGFIANDIDRAREGDILAALQVAHLWTAISTAVSIFTENPAHALATGAGVYSEAIRQSLALYLGG